MIQRCITVNTTSFVGSILLSLFRDSEKEIAPGNEFFSLPKSLFQGASKRGSLETTLV